MHPILLHPLGANPLRQWWTLKRMGGRMDAPHSLPVAALINVAAPCFAPFQAYERWRYKRDSAGVRFDPPPLFIIGHWRTGTTLLHNLLCQDPRNGCITTAQAMAPATSLTRPLLLEVLMRAALPKRRPMDNVALALDAPQEEEVALSNMGVCSLYAGWYFPSLLPRLFERYVLFKGHPAEEVAAWRRHYLALLRKAALLNPGKRLVLKNPPNTARIPLLLDMFPEARFIFLQRNPYAVLKSTQLLHRRMIDTLGFQRCADSEIEQWTLDFYCGLLGRYLEDRQRLGRENLLEMRFEEFEREPLAGVEQAYAALGLGDFEAARPRMQAYLETQRSYKKNTFHISQRDRALVENHWSFALKEWGYDAPPS